VAAAPGQAGREQGESGLAHFRNIDTLPDSAFFLLLTLGIRTSLGDIFGCFKYGVQSKKVVTTEQ